MHDFAQITATLAAGLWAGGCIYIGFAEHPSALRVGVPFATEYFRHMSKRTAPLMMALAAISGISGLYVGWQAGSLGWLTGGAIQLGMFPLTAALIVPINIKLLKVDLDNDLDTAARLHARWGQMDLLRTRIGSIAFPLFVWLLV